MHKLVDTKQETSTLTRAFPEDVKYQEVCKRYAFVRHVRGDGNCFYRALCFGLLESLLRDDRGMQSLKEKLIRSGRELLTAGFDERAFTDLLSIFINVLERSEAEDHEDVLLQLFNDQLISDSMVQYLRLLTSAYLQNHADFFQNFLEAPNLKVYCTQEVETMATECDHVEILALAEALDVGICIVSMEGRDGQLSCHILPEGTEPSLHLLYKTSHYDILYLTAQH
ncbi:ubiquitin thioesterase OTUB2-like [Denticeps clupeoides]|uniref:ubiquitin thioesterase OTUB2-like n=1 Tax=Denticeps clupeoides TaxID=299321 RepID=UPI0010A53047|nr:ubiquitin thioesterase OTUB2 [Denticeps clupeoides]